MSAAAPRLSLCVSARDEQDELRRCLEAVRIADEKVVIVDAASRDATLEVARKHADRVEVRPYTGDVDQKRACLSLASGEWVWMLDPDELPDAALCAAVERVVSGDAPGRRGAQRVGWEMDRLTWHLGRWIRHGDFHPDWTLRLFRRERARIGGQDPHGRVEVDGPVGRLPGTLQHFSYRDLADQVERIQRFSSQAARALHARGRHARLSDLCLRPPARFARAYLLRQGFRDGVPGLVIATATAFHVFLKYAKLWELERSPRRTP